MLKLQKKPGIMKFRLHNRQSQYHRVIAGFGNNSDIEVVWLCNKAMVMKINGRYNIGSTRNASV